jgi:hypothetical protein
MSIHKPECRNKSCPGCGHDSEINKLRRRVVELERENEQLKRQIDELGSYNTKFNISSG